MESGSRYVARAFNAAFLRLLIASQPNCSFVVPYWCMWRRAWRASQLAAEYACAARSRGTSAIGLPLSSTGADGRRSEEGGGAGASRVAAGWGITEPPIMFTVR